MNESRLEALMIAIVQDMAERRTAEERATLNARLFDIGNYIDKTCGDPQGSPVARELREIAREIGRHPRIEP